MDRAFTAILYPSLLGLSLSAVTLRHVLAYVLCLVVATAFHEFAHAITADRLGDRTPGADGRLTLNPMTHADPLGTLLVPAVAGVTGAPLLGWGRPVMTQPSQYTRRISMRAGSALVSFAGPLANILQAAVTLGVVAILAAAGVDMNAYGGLFAILGVFFTLNLTLAALNLLPLHPLDGGKILAWALPSRLDYIDDFLMRYGGIILVCGVMLAPQVFAVLFRPLMQLGYWLMATVSPAWLVEYAEWMNLG